MQQLGTGQESGIGVFGSFRYSPRPGERGARARGYFPEIPLHTPGTGTGREPAPARFAGHGLCTGHRLGTRARVRRVGPLQERAGSPIVEISGRRRRLLFRTCVLPMPS